MPYCCCAAVLKVLTDIAEAGDTDDAPVISTDIQGCFAVPFATIWQERLTSAFVPVVSVIACVVAKLTKLVEVVVSCVATLFTPLAGIPLAAAAHFKPVAVELSATILGIGIVQVLA